MVKVAILGANGFIGSRAVEMLHLSNLAEVRPVVRSVPSLARLSRFDLDCRIADGLDEQALRAAFAGCDVVIHAIAGDPGVIVNSIEPTYRAAEQAGIKRIVYLSTASVHGQNPSTGTDETSSLDRRQPIAYNNAKVHAEQRLFHMRSHGSVEVVLLRPGIVYGPRSFWISSFATDLLAGQAYMVNEGKGICNGIYVDNVIHALYLALSAPEIDGHAFLIGDQEQITWAELYHPIAEALGFELYEAVHLIEPYTATLHTWDQQARRVLALQPVSKGLSLLPKRLRRATKAALAALLKPQPDSSALSSWSLPPVETLPRASLEMTQLHQCHYKLPFAKARAVLGYEPIVSFAEASRRTIGWLAFAGYPVIDNYQLSYSWQKPFTEYVTSND